MNRRMIDWGNFVRLDSDASLDPGEEFESSEARRALPIRIAVLYGGSNAGDVPAEAIPHHGPPFSVRLTLPPMAALVLQPGGKR